jgi:hypothetical protein
MLQLIALPLRFNLSRQMRLSERRAPRRQRRETLMCRTKEYILEGASPPSPCMFDVE